MKYTVKPGDLVNCKGSAATVIRAMKSTRLFRGFGSCYRLRLDDEPGKGPCTCEACGEACSQIPEDAFASMLERSTRQKRQPRPLTFVPATSAA
jgi:hypothetical protein